MNDAPIHLSEYSKSIKEPYSETYINLNIGVRQSELDGIQSLIKFFEGFEKAGNGQVSGSFDLCIFYRSLRAAILATEED